MSGDSVGRLFGRESDFVFWLAKLLEANPNFSLVAIEPLLAAESKGSRVSRPDLMAVRTKDGASDPLVIECKNLPAVNGRDISHIIAQLKRYSGAVSNHSVVLAIPARLGEDDVRAFQNAGIELWDLDTIGALFQNEIARVTPDLSSAFGLEAAQSRELSLIDELRSCIPGRSQWSIYQKLVGRMLEHLFCPPLSAPLSESPDESGVNRRDFVLANFADDKFWSYMRTRYSADYIVVDAKNYVGKVKKTRHSSDGELPEAARRWLVRNNIHS